MKTRNHALDGLRGLAALAVVYGHAILGLDEALVGPKVTPLQALPTAWLVPKAVLMVVNGESAVALFFLLSGCVLRASLVRAFQDLPPVWAAIDFGVRRLLRLIPTTALCIVTMALTFHLLHRAWPDVFMTYSLPQTLGNALLVNSGVNKATWTLVIERAAILPLLVGGAALVRFGEIGAIAFAGYCVAAAVFDHTVPMAGSGLRHAMPLFAFGFLVPGGVGAAVGRVGHTGLLLLAFLVSQHLFVFQEVGGELVRAVLGFAFLCQLYHRGKADSIVCFLEHPVCQYLGKVSFSLYIWNALFLYVLLALAHHQWGPSVPHAVPFGLLGGTLIALLTLPVAHISERYIEQGSVRAGRLFSGVIRSCANRPPECFRKSAKRHSETKHDKATSESPTFIPPKSDGS